MGTTEMTIMRNNFAPNFHPLPILFSRARHEQSSPKATEFRCMQNIHHERDEKQQYVEQPQGSEGEEEEVEERTHEEEDMRPALHQLNFQQESQNENHTSLSPLKMLLHIRESQLNHKNTHKMDTSSSSSYPTQQAATHSARSSLATPVSRFLMKTEFGHIPRISSSVNQDREQDVVHRLTLNRLPSLNANSSGSSPPVLRESLKDYLGSYSSNSTNLSSPVGSPSSSRPLPPIKQLSNPSISPLPPFPLRSSMPIEDAIQRFRYQRSVSCPSDAMVEAPIVPQVVTPSCSASFSIIPTRLERSSSVDSRKLQRVVGATSISDARTAESVELCQWLSKDGNRLNSLAESAQAMIAIERSNPEAHIPQLSIGRQSSSEVKREKKLCLFPNCSSNAVTKGLCISHGGGRRCQRKGCTNIQRSMGLCIRHGGGKRCSIPGCQKGVVRQDLCTAHGGKRKCKVADCNKHVKKKGLCRSHANAVLAAISSSCHDQSM